MHPISFLNPVKDQVTDIEGALLDIVIVITTKLQLMPGMVHQCRHSMLLKTVKVDLTGLLWFAFIVMLNSWSSEDDICGEYGFQPVDEDEG